MITFKEYIKLAESNHNNHGGDRSTHRSAITRMTPKLVKQHTPKNSPRKAFKMHKDKFFKI